MPKFSAVANGYGYVWGGLILVSTLILFYNYNQVEVKFLRNERIFGQILKFLGLVFLTIWTVELQNNSSALSQN